MTQPTVQPQPNLLMEIRVKVKHYFIPSTPTMPLRRYDLDWLRVLVFSLLILFHIGMLYVDGWGYHVKSQYLSQQLANGMLLVSPWRMACLWFISGIAIRFVLSKVPMWRFISVRSVRLLLPLFFAILVIIPPQLYYQMTFEGNLTMSYWQFYQAFWQVDNPIFKHYQPGIWPHIDVNHLWYLRELWLFSMFLLPLLPVLNSTRVQRVVNWCVSQHRLVAITLAVLPILAIQSLNSGDSDSTRNQLGFTFLLYGYLLGCNNNFWQRLLESIRPLLCCYAICYAALLIFYNTVWIDADHNTSWWLLSCGSFIISFSRVIGLLTVLALALKYLNQNSKKLAYFSEAVYPYYIVHQSIIVIVAYEISSLSLGPIVEPIAMILATFCGCFVSFELIKKIELLRPLFGLKLTGNYSSKLNTALGVLSAVIITPLALKIIF